VEERERKIDKESLSLPSTAVRHLTLFIINPAAKMSSHHSLDIIIILTKTVPSIFISMHSRFKDP